MKKYLSLLAAAALILTAAGCSGNDSAETTTTTAAENATAADTTTAAEEAADSEAPVEEAADTTTAAEEVADSEAPAEEAVMLLDEAYISALAEKAPLYAEYARVSATLPYTTTLVEVDESGAELSATTVSMGSMNEIAMAVSQSGATSRIVMADYTYYIISDDTQEGLVQKLDEATWDQLISESTTSVVTLNIDALEVTTGEEELFGTVYSVEDLKDDMMAVKCYFDAETGKAAYMSSTVEYDGAEIEQLIKISDYYNGVDETLFDIPEAYTYTDMSELTQG